MSASRSGGFVSMASNLSKVLALCFCSLFSLIRYLCLALSLVFNWAESLTLHVVGKETEKREKKGDFESLAIVGSCDQQSKRDDTQWLEISFVAREVCSQGERWPGRIVNSREWRRTRALLRPSLRSVLRHKTHCRKGSSLSKSSAKKCLFASFPLTDFRTHEDLTSQALRTFLQALSSLQPLCSSSLTFIPLNQ